MFDTSLKALFRMLGIFEVFVITSKPEPCRSITASCGGFEIPKGDAGIVCHEFRIGPTGGKYGPPIHSFGSILRKWRLCDTGELQNDGDCSMD
jgi:hypothetical protein